MTVVCNGKLKKWVVDAELFLTINRCPKRARYVDVDRDGAYKYFTDLNNNHPGKLPFPLENMVLRQLSDFLTELIWLKYKGQARKIFFWTARIQT